MANSQDTSEDLVLERITIVSNYQLTNNAA